MLHHSSCWRRLSYDSTRALSCLVRPLSTTTTSFNNSTLPERPITPIVKHRSKTPSFDQEVAQLASRPLHPLTLTDLVRFGRPPLTTQELLSSAEFTLRVLPIRLARRLVSLRSLPYIVVSNPHISSIYNNYLHSLRLLLSFPQSDFPTSLKEESRFNDVLEEIVNTHSNTIPILAKGFIQCRKYITPEQTTTFLEEHLRARIGTRLLAEQHLGLHGASINAKGVLLPSHTKSDDPYIGSIHTALNPSTIINSAAEFVGDICDLKYGVRPTIIIDGMKDTTFAYVPVHLEYIMTELLKNAFRATVENGTTDTPIRVTIAAADSLYDEERARVGLQNRPTTTRAQGDTIHALPEAYIERNTLSASTLEKMEAETAKAITIRIRDRGGGIAEEHLPNIFSYSFSTFNQNQEEGENGGMDAISSNMNNLESSTIAGLGFGMGLSRSYAQFFGGDLTVESLWGWGTDVYLGLRGLSVDSL